jgi:hypothetical protein
MLFYFYMFCTEKRQNLMICTRRQNEIQKIDFIIIQKITMSDYTVQ